MTEPILNLNEAPAGYYALQYAAGKGCGACCFRQAGFDEECIRAACFPSEREDGCTVIFRSLPSPVTEDDTERHTPSPMISSDTSGTPETA